MWKCWLKSGRYKESSFGGGIYFFKMVLPVLLDGFSSSKSMMTCFKSRVHFPHIWIVKQKLLKSVWNLDLFLNSSHFFTVNWCVIRVLRFLLNLIEWDAFFFFFLQANCIDSTVPAEAVFAQEVKKLQADQFKPSEQVTLEPFERDHACVVGGYRMPKKQKVPAS